MELPRDLREALDGALTGIGVGDLTTAVARLITFYRTAGAAREPILRSAADVAAYAAYRMPATFAAVRTAVAQLIPSRFAPVSHVDIGGRTGAAAWAAALAFPTLKTTTVLDQVDDALALGRRLADRSDSALLRSAIWRRSRVGAELPAGDLVTVSYVLGERGPEDQTDLVRRAAHATGELLLIVEPGTPAGYGRILAARDVLMGLGCAGINRHEEGDENALHRRGQRPHGGPESCVVSS